MFCSDSDTFQTVISYSNHHTQLILKEKSQNSCAINCWNKIKHQFSSLLLRTNSLIKIKCPLTKKGVINYK